ncbi:HalOD1 output domain-containing protein [Haloarcula litorea]|uniref:HalOD1 output domain-containing protein n=1 Tax=Haloarcula litorea TaxID=3032579 RepID=UPI0023E85172|nr:HalOD1 output domain-containing protein [Halomicroarcula sp. GDY20]
MDSNDGTVYLIRGDEDDEWVSPEPAGEVIADAVVDATDLDVADLEPIESYADADALRAVLGDGDRESLSFDVEGHEVTVTGDGDVSVA